MNGKLWTTTEETEMLDLKAQGHTYAYIAQQLGRNINSVVAHARDIKRREGSYDPIPKHRWTIYDISEMIRMESEGFAVWAIAERLGVTQCAIYQKRRELRKNGELPPKKKSSPCIARESPRKKIRSMISIVYTKKL